MSQQPRTLEGRIALVTGVTGEIGAATARLMVDRGATVVGVDIDEPALRELEAGLGSSFRGIPGDVTDEAAVAAFTGATVSEFGSVDVFFNNAGIAGGVHPVGEYPLAEFRAVVEVNLIGVFLGLKYVVPTMMAAGRGAVINTSSTAGFTGTAGVCAYNATKHAVIGMTRSVGAEAGAAGVRVNAISPGPVSSPMMAALEEGLGDGDAAGTKAALAGRIPLGRYAQADEIAALVAFLASDDARYINCAVLTADGGFTAG